MPGSFTLEIVTPSRLVYAGEVSSLQAPSLDGYFGVLHNRAPLLAALGPGQVKFDEVGAGQRHLAISGGFFQVVKNKAVVLADAAEFADEIDTAKAKAEQDTALQHLTGQILSDDERERWQKALAVARARIKVASMVR